MVVQAAGQVAQDTSVRRVPGNVVHLIRVRREVVQLVDVGWVDHQFVCPRAYTALWVREVVAVKLKVDLIRPA